MKQRKPAPPIFDIDELPSVYTVSNPLPKINPIDIVLSDDEESSSFEEIAFNIQEKPNLANVDEFWTFISKMDWQDRPLLTINIRDRVKNSFSQLTNKDKFDFIEHIKNFKNKLSEAINNKKLYDKFHRKLNDEEKNLLLVHVIMRGKNFYETMVADPSPVGYLIGKTSTTDEFPKENIFNIKF